MRTLLRSLLASALVVGLLGAPAAGSTTDPFRGKQWGLDKISAEAAWEVTRGTGILVAVVDTGVDLTHPDLAANIVGPGADLVDPAGADGAQDENGHGTHVAGIIAAVAGNGAGIAGVAPEARLLPVRVLDKKGSGTTKQIADGIRYAADQGAQVINLSLGFQSPLGEIVKVVGGVKPVYEAIDYAFGRGAVVVFAAGNDSVPVCAEPAAHSKVLCVGATDRSDARSYFSSGDATMTKRYLMAPGGDGLSCSGGVFSAYLASAPEAAVCSDDPSYESLAGTSMAAPHVSGVAALLASKGLGQQAIIQCLISTADDLGLAGRDPIFGYGRVDAAAAVSSC